MSVPSTHRYVLRAVIEFTTPFLVGAGRGGDVADAVFVADANGLPALPGSSLAGALRAAFHGAGHSPEDENRLFGYQDGDTGAGSRLSVSWACIHDQHDRPVEGIVEPRRLDDPVLAMARVPTIRDHVRISHRGAADSSGHGKFDEQAVGAGQRFTFEMELDGVAADERLWDALLGVVGDPALRLGGRTRRGFGGFRIVSAGARVFDLAKDFGDYSRHPVSLASPSPVLSPLKTTAGGVPSSWATIRVDLRPQGYWMFGGGQDLAGVLGDADMAPVRDCRVVWNKGHGRVVEDLVVLPGTGIKGALAHRVAFHYNALSGTFADGLGADGVEAVTGPRNGAVGALFGFCKGDAGEDGEDGRRGRVVIDDLFLEASPPSQLVHHVGIDRFTGGARDQVLFCERPFWQGGAVAIAIHVEDPSSLDGRVREALRLAIVDLVEGRLQMGAGAGRGLGYFRGTAEWPEAFQGTAEGPQ
ncbi:MAG: hypothetical protein GX595_12095 [Lentisphaerae bacterium]|nr:hypothetical protein [Lentisphaerota bacterium]